MVLVTIKGYLSYIPPKFEDLVLDHFESLSNSTASFPLQMAMDAYVFVIFIVIQIIFVVYIKVVVPETKNRPIEEITALFK